MKKIWGKLIVIVYVLVFAVNLGFAVVDIDDLFLPEYVKVIETGGLSGHHEDRFSVSRENGKYYINHSIEITREEYRMCVGSRKDYEEPQKFPVGSDAFAYSFYVKYPFSEEKYYDIGYCGSALVQRMKIVMRNKERGEEAPEIERALTDVFEKYDVRGGYVHYFDGEHSIRTLFYGELITHETYDDERYIKINDAYTAELANMRMYSRRKKMYPGTNTKLMAKYVEKETGMKISDYVPKEPGIFSPKNVSVLNFYGISVFFTQKKDTGYMSLKAAKYYRFRYFDHALKGKEPVYFKDASCDDLTVISYVIPGEKKAGCIVIETDDLLTRQLMIMDIKLAILTDGKFPVLRGTRLTAHVLFIGMVQILVLAGVMIVKTLITDRKKVPNTSRRTR